MIIGIFAHIQIEHMSKVKRALVVIAVVVISVLLTRLLMQLVFDHGQAIISLDNILLGLALPFVLIFFEKVSTMQSLLLKTAAYVVALTLIDYLLKIYADWPSLMW